MQPHLGRRHGPDFEIIWTHEDLSKMLSHVSYVPLIEILRPVRGVADTSFKRGIYQTLDTSCLLLFRQNGDVILERVWYPLALIADIRDPLVRIPVGRLWEGFVDAIVEVLVVREDDVSSNIKQLRAFQRLESVLEMIGTR